MDNCRGEIFWSGSGSDPPFSLKAPSRLMPSVGEAGFVANSKMSTHNRFYIKHLIATAFYLTSEKRLIALQPVKLNDYDAQTLHAIFVTLFIKL